MFGFFPVFFSRASSFFFRLGSLVVVRDHLLHVRGDLHRLGDQWVCDSSACKRASSTDPISRAMDRDMGAAVLLAAVLAAAGAGRAMLLSPASAVPAPTPLKKSRRVSFMFFLLCKLADMPC